MLILTRKVGESVIIGENIRVMIAAVEGDRVRIGITAPRETAILRQELQDAVRQENKAAVEIDSAALTDIQKLILPASAVNTGQDRGHGQE